MCLMLLTLALTSSWPADGCARRVAYAHAGCRVGREQRRHELVETGAVGVTGELVGQLAAIAVEAHQRTAFGTAARGAVDRLRVLHAKVAGAVPGATDPQRTLQHEGAVVGVVIMRGEVEVGRDHL